MSYWKEVMAEALRKSYAPNSLMMTCRYVSVDVEDMIAKTEERIDNELNSYTRTFENWIFWYPTDYVQAYPHLPECYQIRKEFDTSILIRVDARYSLIYARTLLTREQLEFCIENVQNEYRKEAEHELAKRQENFMERLIDSL